MRSSTRGLVATGVVAVVSLAACKDHKADVNVNGTTVKVDASNVSFAKRDSSRELGLGDMRIATTDSALEVALIGDSLVAGFGAATRARIHEATDTGTVHGSGLGANIEKLVKSTVAGALDHELYFPLSEISDIQYEDGLLVFYDKDGKRMHVMERDHEKGKPSRFAEADAKAFIAVFKSKKTGKA